jgi:hypothetical protein
LPGLDYNNNTVIDGTGMKELLRWFGLIAKLSIGLNFAINQMDIVAFPETIRGDIPEIFLVATA